MNREIKFRYYNKSLKKMICSDIFTNFYEFWEQGCYMYEDNTMQFTNLYDRKNKEIYEGDIVLINNIDGECTGENVIGVVAFTHGHYYVCDNIDDEPLHEFCINQTEKLDLEIIGNIHENPELLK